MIVATAAAINNLCKGEGKYFQGGASWASQLQILSGLRKYVVWEPTPPQECHQYIVPV